MSKPNPFDRLKTPLHGSHFYDFTKLGDPRVAALPISVRVLLEAAIRNCDEFLVTSKDVETILDWRRTQTQQEIQFKPARVIMQDFTGVPAVVDLAAMRDCVQRLGGDAQAINPLVPVDLVIDHSVQVDASRGADSLDINEAKEFERNTERFQFLKWGSTAFQNLSIVPPGNGIVHQVNLEYLARVVFNLNGLLYPDTVVGTDSHTTMINGLGVLGWGVGGIEAEAAMLGQPSSMLLPEVIGFRLTGALPAGATATDAVLTLTAQLRKFGVVNKLVEFFGPGVASLSLADRATISNMAPEYGATCGFFPVDEVALAYLTQTGRTPEHVSLIRDYLKAVGLFVDFGTEDTAISYTAVLSLDLSTVVPCIAGPKRPHDYVAVSAQKGDFAKCVANPASDFKGFGLTEAQRDASATLSFKGTDYTIKHGHVVIAAITSCTNTSNPGVLIAAGLVAKKALARGLLVAPYIKTSLSPGSQAVEAYLRQCGLLEDLSKQGFEIAGYGCMTCIGNSGELYPGVGEAFVGNKIVATSVLSGNRNFEARVHPDTAGNYLASPPLVVAYALAGTMAIDLQTEPLGVGSDGRPVFLSEIWPSNEEIADMIRSHVTAEVFSSVYGRIKRGNARWDGLKVPAGAHYAWDDVSTYIHNPPFFSTMQLTTPPRVPIAGASCLLYLGDSITTDHISPAGDIAKVSSAAKFLTSRGLAKADYNTYGARRGNDLVMARGTFANTRLGNKIIGPGATGPVTIHFPSGEQLPVYEASQKYIEAGIPLIILAGKDYGCGSSRDWAAKGPYLLGVKAVIAESFERIHRSNLAGMGIVPLCFKAGVTAESLGLRGTESFTVDLPEVLTPGMDISVTAGTTTFHVTLRLDTDAEVAYHRHGGLLHYVLRNKVQSSAAH